jgi:hypothetical protein
MRAGAVTILLGLTALVAYSLGRQDVPASKPIFVINPAAPAQGASPSATNPAALPHTGPPDTASSAKPPPALAAPSSAATPTATPNQSNLPDAKRKAEVVLTAAAIAAILIRASRDQYYRTGHPCACPDDLMRNGRACGGRSAYSRPGGAAPLCYPTDVTPAMIEAYRRTATASR